MLIDRLMKCPFCKFCLEPQVTHFPSRSRTQLENTASALYLSLVIEITFFLAFITPILSPYPIGLKRSYEQGKVKGRVYN